MKEPLQILDEAQDKIEEFIEWHVNTHRATDFREFAQGTAKAAQFFQYAALLYPKFIKVEDSIVLAEHYSEENWLAWRQKLDARRAAQIINHVHLEHYLYGDYQGVTELDEYLGDLIAFFWQMAVQQQFPEDNVHVEYNGDVINVYQPPL